MTVVAFSKFFTRRGEGHVPVTNHSLIDDINIDYIYFTVYLQASGQVSMISSNKMSSITDSPYADVFLARITPNCKGIQ